MQRLVPRMVGAAVLFSLDTWAAMRAQAQVESVLHSFAGGDGAHPVAALIIDSSGNPFTPTVHDRSSENCFEGCGSLSVLATWPQGGTLWL